MRLIEKASAPVVDHSLKVRDLMSEELLTLTEEDSLKTLEDLFKWKRIRHVPIVDDTNELVGLITHRDFLTVAVSKLAHLEQKKLDEIYGQMRLGDIMGRKVTTIDPDALLSEAAAIMYSNKFGCLPVVKERKLVGILTESDFALAFLGFNLQLRN